MADASPDSSATQSLCDRIMATGWVLEPEGATTIATQLALNPTLVLSFLADEIGLDVLLSALLDAYGPDSIVRSLVDTDVLVELQREGWNPDAGSVATNMIRVERPWATLPLYRIAGEADRG